jgi:DNA-binding HxlR family transcriptional regulator
VLAWGRERINATLGGQHFGEPQPFAWHNFLPKEILTVANVNNPSASGAKVASTIYLGKWSVSILSSLRDKPHRHGELRRRLGGVSQRILTRTLRNLEAGGLITRSVNNSKPIAVEYSLTPIGRTFMGPLTNLCQWANRYDKELSATVRLLNIDGKS